MRSFSAHTLPTPHSFEPTLQALVRGKQTRFNLRMKREREDRERTEGKSARLIQKVHRGGRARAVASRLAAARRIQANFRGFHQRQKLLEHVCTVMLQSQFRGWRARNRLQNERAASAIVWASKRRLAHKKFSGIARVRANALLTVGRFVRMQTARLRFWRVRRAVRRLQAR